jgi:deoxyribodipyrimidine photolyase
MWSEGVHNAQSQPGTFLEKVEGHSEAKNFPAENNTSLPSAFFAPGALSSRTVVAKARDETDGRLDSEVA